MRRYEGWIVSGVGGWKGGDWYQGYLGLIYGVYLGGGIMEKSLRVRYP